MKATAKDLRFHSKELLEAVARGEEVTITYRGKPCAKLVPVSKRRCKKLESELSFGLWKDNPAVSDVDNYLDGLRGSHF